MGAESLRKPLGRAAACVALIALAACAGSPLPTLQSQPALARLAQPYASQMAAVGIVTLDVAGRGSLMRAYTNVGTVYVRYPDNVASTRFVLQVDGASLSAESDDFTAAQSDAYAQALQAIVPETIRAVQSNNQIMYDRANPDH